MNAPQHAPQQPPAPMQEVYPNVAMSVQERPEGGKFLAIQVPLPRKDLIFPLSDEAALEIGSKLQAPSVVRAHSNGHAGLIVPPGGLQ